MCASVTNLNLDNVIDNSLYVDLDLPNANNNDTKLDSDKYDVVKDYSNAVDYLDHNLDNHIDPEDKLWRIQARL